MNESGVRTHGLPRGDSPGHPGRSFLSSRPFSRARFMSLWCGIMVTAFTACSPAPAARGGDELRVTLSIPRQVRHGEHVPGTLTLYNPSRRSREVRLPGRPDSAFFDVTASGPDGREVWRLRPPAAPQAGEHLRTIAPGGSLAVTFNWPQRVPPGTYRLQGIFATSSDTLRSEPARVEVTP